MSQHNWTRKACAAVLLSAVMAVASQAQTLTTMLSFDGTNGANPLSMSLVQGTDRNLYGTTFQGGANGMGTVFKITPEGTLTTLYSFCAQANCADGWGPIGGVVQATDGNFYGTTSSGGISNDQVCISGGCGTVFKITPEGTLTTLYRFCAQTNCADGAYSSAGLVQATDGTFYGTTSSGGILDPGCFNGCGTVFKITPQGTLTTLYTFCSQTNCTDGAAPLGGLFQASDGNFYGTTAVGGTGTNGYGTVFKITPEGTLTTLYNFCAQTDCSDGSRPSAGLVQATDGSFYGTTYGGGTNGAFCPSEGDGCGTVFKITPEGMLTTLHTFCQQSGCADGYGPQAGLVQATDRNFYGTTAWGGGAKYCPESGAFGCGTAFEISQTGELTTLHTFKGTDGASVYAGLVQAADGNFYGATWGGGTGTNGYGTVFRLAIGLSTTTTLSIDATPSSSQSYQGTPVTFIATVRDSTGNAVPTGTVTFASKSTVLGTGALSDGVATYTTSSLAAGTYSVTATYSGDANYAGSSSPATGLIVIPMPVVSLSPLSVAFPSQYVDTSGLPQTVTLKNTGYATLTISGTNTTAADFGELNACGNSVAVGASCSIGVFFDPTTAGTRSGTLTITDNAPGSPQAVLLTGMGQDFSIAAGSQTTATVTPGQSARYMVSVAPGGGFNQMVALSCSGAPAQSTCSLSPSSITLEGTAVATAVMTVTTAGSSAALTQPIGWPPTEQRFGVWLTLSGTLGLTIFLNVAGWRRERRGLLTGLLFLFLVAIGSTMLACGGGNGSSGGGGGGTPAGTYSLTVTGTFTSGSTVLKHAVPLTLIVQ
jgi:uncharacterized repeat protein (TIGR03803 family)